MANTLFLRLEGPLQSWGERGRWSIRDTAPEPTKSGVIGLISCAMGLRDDEPIRSLSVQTRMGVRRDKAGTLLTDYHTIGGGAREPMLLTAEGKPKKSSGKPHTEISYRDYLADASFLVALQGPSTLVEEMASAVQDPVWVVFLGRKACPPVRPLFDGLGQYDSLQQALTIHNWPQGEDRLTAVLQCSPADDDAQARLDHLHARSHRLFHPRYTRTVTLFAKPSAREEAS